MRNFHRDFESLNEAYMNKVQTKCECTINESVTDDIATKHREGSLKSLREALRALAKAHHEDYSNVTMEDVYTEMKLYAEENLPTQPEVTVPAGPDSPIHNPSPMGIATEDATAEEEDEEETVDETVGIRAARTDEENFEADRKAAGLKKQGEIMKKDLEDEEKEAKEKKVGENFEQMLEIMRLSDQTHPESNDVVEEEMYDCIRDYMGEGMSYAEAKRECSGRGHEESVQSESGCGTHKETDEDPDDGAEEKDVDELDEAVTDAELQKSDDAFKIGFNQAMKVTDKQNAKKFGTGWMSNKGVKQVTKGMNDYMTALSSKLTKMADQLKN